MSNSIDREKVLDTARLARIQLAPDQVDSFLNQLGGTLDYINQLTELEIGDDVEPFFGAIESVNAIRPDECKPSIPREDILANAPDADGEFYLVPPVLGNE